MLHKGLTGRSALRSSALVLSSRVIVTPSRTCSWERRSTTAGLWREFLASVSWSFVLTQNEAWRGRVILRDIALLSSIPKLLPSVLLRAKLQLKFHRWHTCCCRGKWREDLLSSCWNSDLTVCDSSHFKTWVCAAPESVMLQRFRTKSL